MTQAIKPVIPGKVLIVDDLATNRFLLRSMLKTEGYQIEEASNGIECLEYCKKEMPIMILLDVMMPELDGISACRKLREFHSKEELPIILVTTRTEGADVLEGIEAGANDYVAKPIDRGVLVARVANQLVVAAAYREINLQRHSLEQALKIQTAMGDVLSHAIMVHDTDGNVVYRNRQLEVLCGGEAPVSVFEVLEVLLQGKLLDLGNSFAEEIAKNPLCSLHRELELAELGRNFDINSRPVPVDEGELLRLWTLTDMTRTRELERKISEQVKLEMVSVFAAGVSHNFNNIMGGILGATELLDRLNQGNEKAQRYTNMIRKGIDSGRQLTHKMAGLVRREGESSPALTQNFSEVLEAVVTSLQPLTGERVTISRETRPNLPAILINQENLSDILRNILTNAIDSIAVKGEIIFKTSYNISEKFVVCSCRDTGCGMNNEALARIFEPFYTTKNLDSVNGVSIQGNGLGLWNVHSLIKMSGGDIKISSRVGVGTEVLMTFPAQA